MDSEDPIPDRDKLQQVATRRVRVLLWLVAGLTVLSLVAGFTAGMIANGGSVGRRGIALGVTLLIALAIGAVVVWWTHRRQGGPQLVNGADRGTRRAVQQALRTGRPADARIDALTRQIADRIVRNSWLMVFCGVLLLVQIVVLVLRITGGDGLGEVALSAVTIVFLALMTGVFVVMRARSVRYLRREPGSVH